jgi:hypothetical protein
MEPTPVEQVRDALLETLLPIALIGLALLLVVALLAAALWLVRGRTRREHQPVYQAVDSLLTASERRFFDVLVDAVEHPRIFAKVRLLDLLHVPRGLPGRQAHLNRVMSKHIDFVLCDHQSLRPLLVIELDDASHDRRDRRERDEFVDGALADAGIPVLHVSVASSYSAVELRRQIEECVTASLPVRGAP